MKTKKLLAIAALLCIGGSLLYSAVTGFSYLQGGNIPCNLTGLAIGATRACAMVSQITNGDAEAQIYIRFKTGAAATGSMPSLSYGCLGAVGSATTCTDNGEVTGADATITLPAATSMPTLAGPPCNSAASTYTICGPYSLYSTWNGNPPAGWGIVFTNGSGVALDGICSTLTNPPCGVYYDRVLVKNAYWILWQHMKQWNWPEIGYWFLLAFSSLLVIYILANLTAGLRAASRPRMVRAEEHLN